MTIPVRSSFYVRVEDTLSGEVTVPFSLLHSILMGAILQRKNLLSYEQIFSSAVFEEKRRGIVIALATSLALCENFDIF